MPYLRLDMKKRLLDWIGLESIGVVDICDVDVSLIVSFFLLAHESHKCLVNRDFVCRTLPQYGHSRSVDTTSALGWETVYALCTAVSDAYVGSCPMGNTNLSHECTIFAIIIVIGACECR